MWLKQVVTLMFAYCAQFPADGAAFNTISSTYVFCCIADSPLTNRHRPTLEFRLSDAKSDNGLQSWYSFTGLSIYLTV